MTTKTLFAFFATGLLLAGCGSSSEAPTAGGKAVTPQLAEVNGVSAVRMDSESIRLAGITTVTAGRDSLSTSVEPTGEVQPTDSGTVQVTSRLPGKITQALVSVGQRVHKGQVLAYVDSVDLAQARATYQTAVSHANLSRNQLEQQKKLAGFGAISEQPVEDARKAAVAADAAVGGDEAQIRVDRLALESTRRLVDMGEITRKPVEDAQNALSQAQAAASQAAVSLKSAKMNLDRAKTLLEGGIYSRQQLEDADAAYNTALSGSAQAETALALARQELNRQETIFKQNLNGAGSLQGAQSKLQQDQHTYQNDVVAQSLAHTQYQRALAVRKSGIPVSQALQQAQDAYDEAVVAEEAAANTLKLYGVQPNSIEEARNGAVVIPIVAPIEGLVAARSMIAGQNIDTSANLVRLLNLDHVYVDAQIYESDVREVAVGDSVQVHVSALPGRTFVGKVQWVADEINADTRTATVRTDLGNPGWVLRPGMFATVLIGSKKKTHSIAVPVDAVMQEGDKQVVYVQVSPTDFVKRVVTTGDPVGGKLPIRTGVASGDKVVVGGNILIEKAQEQLESEKAGSK